MATAHPSLNEVAMHEWRQYFTYSGETVLGTGDHHRIVFSHIFAGDEREFAYAARGAY